MLHPVTAETLLHIAGKRDATTFARQLIWAGVDPGITCNEGRTRLDAVRRQGSSKAIPCLQDALSHPRVAIDERLTKKRCLPVGMQETPHSVIRWCWVFLMLWLPNWNQMVKRL